MEMKELKPLISVYTCVYNMADKIHRALGSVKWQTYRNIEHIIVNDGSNDNVEEIIQQYINSVTYKVKYIKKENGGKHTALNVAWELVEGEWMINLDADDSLLPDALEFLVNELNKIPDSIVDEYWCILGRCQTQMGKMVGEMYPDEMNELTKKEQEAWIKKVTGEKIGLQRSFYITQFRFPEPQHVSMIPEHVVYYHLNNLYRTWFTNRIVRVYYINEGGNLTEKPKTPKQFSNKAYAAKWDFNNLNLSLFDKVYMLVKYLIAFNLATNEYRRNYPLMKEFSFCARIILFLLFLPSKVAAKFVFKKHIN